MAVKIYKPITPGMRGMTGYTFEEITKSKPERSLITFRKQNSGRNNYGRVTVRHRGGGARRFIRTIDVKRDKIGVPAVVNAIEYDPNRTARIALLFYKDGEKRYILAPLGLKPGDTVVSGPNADIRVGNAMPIANIPVGSTIHNIELKPGKGGQMVRSAGTSAQLLAKEGKYAQVRLPSGEVRMVVVKAVSRLVCPVRRLRGVNRHWVTRLVTIRRRIALSFAAAMRRADASPHEY